jgi:hypothetical protein
MSLEQYRALRIPAGHQRSYEVKEALESAFGVGTCGYAKSVNYYAHFPAQFEPGDLILEAVGVIEDVTTPAKSEPVEPYVGMRFEGREILKLYTDSDGVRNAVIAYYDVGCNGVWASEPHSVRAGIGLDIFHPSMFPQVTTPATTKRVFRRFSETK